MPTQVEQYALGRSASGGFAYRIKLAGRDWGNWIMVSAADLAAFAALFKQSPLYAHPDGSITTGAEPIGG